VEVIAIAEKVLDYGSTLLLQLSTLNLSSLVDSHKRFNVDRYVRVQMAQMDYQERSQKEHYQLLDACCQQDIKAAIRLLKQHIDTAGEELVECLQQKAAIKLRTSKK